MTEKTKENKQPYSLYEDKDCYYRIEKTLSVNEAIDKEWIHISKHDSKKDAKLAKKAKEEFRDSTYIIARMEKKEFFHRLFKEAVFNRKKPEGYFLIARFDDFTSAKERLTKLTEEKNKTKIEKKKKQEEEMQKYLPALEKIAKQQNIDMNKKIKLSNADKKYLEWTQNNTLK